MAKRWRVHPHDPDRIASLQRATDVPAVVAQLLICRNMVDPEAIRAFLDPKLSSLRDPQLLPGCAEATDIVHQALGDNQRIVIFGDYDVDGMTGTAILWLCLKLLGANVGYYVPSRIDEGYGLSGEAMRSLAEQKTQLIVTVDCGVGSSEEVALAYELGMKVVITDHHRPGLKLPEAAAIVHPALPAGNYPFAGLSGSAVALKLAWALCQKACGEKRVPKRMKDFLMQAVGLAAMGTIADVVPLIDENRVLVKHGLTSVAQYPTLGLSKLMEIARLEGKKTLASEDIGFALAPRLNAAGRLGQPQLAVELLTTDQPERAQELAEYIDQLNATRKTLERSMLLAANKQIKRDFNPQEDAALVLADRGWHPGVIGILAGRLAEKHHRPVVIISWDKLGIKPGVGAARSIAGFDLHAALEACDDYLLGHGGHAAAAGLSIEEGRLDGFRTAFCELAAEQINEAQRTAELAIDAEVPLSALTLQAVRQIEQLAPFGKDNPRPLLCTSGVDLAGPPKPIGGGHHLSLQLSQHGVKFRAVAFGAGHWADELSELNGPIDIAFRPVINSFHGRHNVELHLVDYKAG